MPLYKYFSPDRSGVLEKCELRVTPFSELNDPFEAAPVFAVPDSEVLVSRLRKLVTETVDSRLPALDATRKAAMVEAEVAEHKARFLSEVSQPHHWENAALDLQRKISSAWGTICLSESDDNLLMWSHYAHGHRGFVLGFDEHHHQFRVARAVEYRPERPVVRQDESSPTEFFLRKAELWKYERERRVFMELGKCDVKKQTDDGLIHLLRIDPSSVVSVILGSKVSKHLQSLAARAIGTKFFPRARLKIAIPHLSEFKVEIHDIGGGKESLLHGAK